MIGFIRKKLFFTPNFLLNPKTKLYSTMQSTTAQPPNKPQKRNQSSPKPQTYEFTNTIQTTQHEEKIFETLLSVVSSRRLDLTLRVAGGWVRDKVKLI